VRLERIKGMLSAEDISKLNLFSYITAELCSGHGGACKVKVELDILDRVPTLGFFGYKIDRYPIKLLLLY
jgi:hypothetical protein